MINIWNGSNYCGFIYWTLVLDMVIGLWLIEVWYDDFCNKDIIIG